MTQTFVVGKTYATRSIGDHDCIYSFEILARTTKTVTIKVHGDTVRRGVYVYNGVEQFKPHGTHSMCAIVSATDKAEALGAAQSPRKPQTMTKNELMAALAAIPGNPQVTLSVVDSNNPDEYLSDLRIPAIAVHHYDDAPYIVVHSTMIAPPPES